MNQKKQTPHFNLVCWVGLDHRPDFDLISSSSKYTHYTVGGILPLKKPLDPDDWSYESGGGKNGAVYLRHDAIQTSLRAKTFHSYTRNGVQIKGPLPTIHYGFYENRKHEDHVAWIEKDGPKGVTRVCYSTGKGYRPRDHSMSQAEMDLMEELYNFGCSTARKWWREYLIAANKY